MITSSEVIAITEANVATTNDLRYIGPNGTTNNSAQYILASYDSSSNMYITLTFGLVNSGTSTGSFVVRLVIVLKDGIRTTEKTTDAVGQEAWVLIKS